MGHIFTRHIIHDLINNFLPELVAGLHAEEIELVVLRPPRVMDVPLYGGGWRVFVLFSGGRLEGVVACEYRGLYERIMKEKRGPAAVVTHRHHHVRHRHCRRRSAALAAVRPVRGGGGRGGGGRGMAVGLGHEPGRLEHVRWKNKSVKVCVCVGGGGVSGVHRVCVWGGWDGKKKGLSGVGGV